MKGGANILTCSSVTRELSRFRISSRRVSRFCRFLKSRNIRLIKSGRGRSPGIRRLTGGRRRFSLGSLDIPPNIGVGSPIHVCLGRVKHISLLSTRRRVTLTGQVRRNSRRTGEHLTRTGLQLIMDVTGECIKHKVLFLSLVRRKGVKLVGTIRGFSCHGKFGFDACTA